MYVCSYVHMYVHKRCLLCSHKLVTHSWCRRLIIGVAMYALTYMCTYVLTYGSSVVLLFSILMCLCTNVYYSISYSYTSLLMLFVFVVRTKDTHIRNQT